MDSRVDDGYRGRSRSPRSPPPRYRRSYSRSRSPPRRKYREERERSFGSRSPAPMRRSRYPSKRVDDPEPNTCLGVFGLNLRTNEGDLERVFGQFGHLEKVVVVFDRRSNQSRGFGFVYFDSLESATKAREATNGIDIDGKIIRVDYSVTQKPHERTPGYYAGRSQRPRSPQRRRYRSRSRSPYRRRRSYSRSRSR